MIAITLDQIGQAILDRLKNSAAILAKSVEIYGVPHQVFYVASGSESPPMSDAPQLGVIPIKKNVPQNGAASFEFILGITLLSPDRDESATASGVNVTQYSGAGYLEQLADLALAEIVAISPALDWAGMDLEIDPVTFFPHITGAISLMATVYRAIGTLQAL